MQIDPAWLHCIIAVRAYLSMKPIVRSDEIEAQEIEDGNADCGLSAGASADRDVDETKM